MLQYKKSTFPNRFSPQVRKMPTPDFKICGLVEKSVGIAQFGCLMQTLLTSSLSSNFVSPSLSQDEKYSATQIEANVESDSKPADEQSSKSDQSGQNISQKQATETNNNNKSEVTPQQKGSLLERNSHKPPVAKNLKAKQVSLPNINRQTTGPRNTWKKYQVSSSSESSEETSSSDESDSSGDS